MIKVGDIVKLRGTSVCGIVIKQQSDGYIIDWFTFKSVFESNNGGVYHSSYLIKVSQ